MVNAAQDDDEEVKRLLIQFMEDMGRAWQIPLLTTQPAAEEKV